MSHSGPEGMYRAVPSIRKPHPSPFRPVTSLLPTVSNTLLFLSIFFSVFLSAQAGIKSLPSFRLSKVGVPGIYYMSLVICT